MKRDEIIRIAREAGEAEGMAEFIFHPVVERFAALVAEAEREACAKVCELIAINAADNRASECAAAIRARMRMRRVGVQRDD